MLARAIARIGSASAARIVFMGTPGELDSAWEANVVRTILEGGFNRQKSRRLRESGKRNACHGLSVFEESDEFRGDVPERIKDGGGVARQQSVRIGTPDAHSAYNIASRRQKLPRFQSPL